ncbi:polyamine ABC transporter ATP-binding protein, partial [Pseudomonas sp. BAgro211]|nr:polyamine ABC transporter ATP-binding protein [Pseudomonas sp. BAgro211]
RARAHGNAAAEFEGRALAIRPTANLREGQDILLMVRPEKAQVLSPAQAAATPLAAGWNEIPAKVAETVFLGESLTCSVVTASG